MINIKGRLENELKTRKNIEKLLAQMPECVTGYYYSIRSSVEVVTCMNYIRVLYDFNRFLNGKDITQIDSVIIGMYFEKIDYVRSEEGVQRKTSAAYKQKAWTALNQFYDYLLSEEYIKKNPVSNIKRPKNTDVVERKFLSMDDLNKILKNAENGCGSKNAILAQHDWRDRDVLILYLFMNTGMRRTALSEINVEDVSFENKTITVIDKRHKTQIYNMTDELESLIKKWLTRRERLLNGVQTDALFISNQRTRLTDKSIYRLVKKYSQNIVKGGISPHKLRAAFVTLFYEASGGDIKATCEAVGHADISTTSLYIVKKNNSRADAANFMSKNLKINI